MLTKSQPRKHRVEPPLSKEAIKENHVVDSINCMVAELRKMSTDAKGSSKKQSDEDLVGMNLSYMFVRHLSAFKSLTISKQQAFEQPSKHYFE